MGFERQIDYLEYRVRGEKVMCCGFARTIFLGDRVTLELAVNGLKREWPWEIQVISEQTEFLPVEICAGGHWHSAGYLNLSAGSGNFRTERILQNGEEAMQKLWHWSEIRIPMDGERTIGCVRETEEPVRNAEETVRPEIAAAELPMHAAELLQQEEMSVREEYADWEAHCPAEQKEPLGENEGKWDRISRIYPHIHPFGDGREYISIRSEDFLLLSEDSYRRADNSFAGHGYCNYGYFVLLRKEKETGNLYYFGVPGNYYPQEIAAAKYFGFQTFEGADDKTENGEFGFYLMKVEL